MPRQSLRTLRASSQGVEKARRALITSSLTQKELAAELNVTRLPIVKFFSSRPVGHILFTRICAFLNLNWEEIALITDGEVEQGVDLQNKPLAKSILSKRSLQASLEGIRQAEIALVRKSLNQTMVASSLDISRPPVVNFFAGKPVERNIFVKICEILELNWESIAITSNDSHQTEQESTIHLKLPISSSVPKSSKNTCRLTKHGLLKVKSALIRLYITKTELSKILQLSRTTINRFLRGDSINQLNFISICDFLELDWQELANMPDEIDALVQLLRKLVHDYIQERCGTIKVLHMSHPINLAQVYTSVNVLEKLPSRLRWDISDLLTLYDSTRLDIDKVSLGKVLEDKVSAISAVSQHPKLLILGKPGSGKTTLLKYLAIQCNLGNYLSSHVPIFITFKELAYSSNEPDILEYITQYLSFFGVSSNHVLELLKQGRVLFLLDGLDEVSNKNTTKLINNIYQFSNYFYRNKFVITTRTASINYTLNNFVEVEVADFNLEQVKSFIHKWYEFNESTKGDKLIQKLTLPENKPILELAINPLLLTMLCLVFDEGFDLLTNRAELYAEGTRILLKKWDSSRNIERDTDTIYRSLTVSRKEGLLSEIAAQTFELGNYFFKQEDAEKYIINYIEHLFKNSDDANEIKQTGKNILKSIEVQSGLLLERAKAVYSFSHLTFHEYFTAKYYTLESGYNNKLSFLVNHITEQRWREVFILTVSMLPSADYFLQMMKQKTDEILLNESQLQEFLCWLLQESKLLGISRVETLRLLEGILNGKLNSKYQKEFSIVQKELLWKYHFANKLIIDCLKTECYVSRHTRQEIEDRLLLPIGVDIA